MVKEKMVMNTPNNKCSQKHYQSFITMISECSRSHSETVREQLSLESTIFATQEVLAPVQSVNELYQSQTRRSYPTSTYVYICAMLAGDFYRSQQINSRTFLKYEHYLFQINSAKLSLGTVSLDWHVHIAKKNQRPFSAQTFISTPDVFTMNFELDRVSEANYVWTKFLHVKKQDYFCNASSTTSLRKPKIQICDPVEAHWIR